MSVEANRNRAGWCVRWREDGHNRSRVFERREDAKRFDAEMKRRKSLWLPVPEPLIAKEKAEIRRWAKKNRRKVGDPRSWVYVLAAPELGYLKIGRSSNPDERLRTHMTSAPVKLVTLLVVPGGEALERKLLDITSRFVVDGAGTEWRTREALDVIFALIVERSR